MYCAGEHAHVDRFVYHSGCGDHNSHTPTKVFFSYAQSSGNPSRHEIRSVSNQHVCGVTVSWLNCPWKHIVYECEGVKLKDGGNMLNWHTSSQQK